MGRPDPERICTSHVERQNLSMRMGIRRFTRLTNAFSKKWENHCAAIMLWYAFYNFCRVHRSLRTTPAMAAGIVDHIWSVRELLEHQDNFGLDTMGFAPFGKVVSGMDVVDQLFKGYGDAPPSGAGPEQGRIREEGNEYLERSFPRLDYIETGTIQ